VIRVIALMVTAALTFIPSAGLTIESSYDCVLTGHTNIGWSSRDGKYTAESITKVSKPSIVSCPS
jgi:hypothetical protein